MLNIRCTEWHLDMDNSSICAWKVHENKIVLIFANSFYSNKLKYCTKGPKTSKPPPLPKNCFQFNLSDTRITCSFVHQNLTESFSGFSLHSA